MKSLAIAGLALLSGAAAANVHGNNNHGILGVDSSSSQIRNNQGIINVFGGNGNHNAAGNKGFVNVLPFHIVRDDEADNELANVHGNNNHGILGVDSSNSQIRNNQGILNVFGGNGNHDAAGNKGFVNVLPFHIVRDDEADNELRSDELVIHNQRGGRVTINNHDDELFNLIHIGVENAKYNLSHNSGTVVVNGDVELIGDDEFFSFDKSSFNMAGNEGKIHFNTDTPVKAIKNMNISKNHGQITQTDSNGKTTIIEGEHTHPHHARNTTKPHSGPKVIPHHLPIRPLKPVHPSKPVETQPTKPTKPVVTMPGMNDMDTDMNTMNLAMKKMETDMEALNQLKSFLAK